MTNSSHLPCLAAKPTYCCHLILSVTRFCRSLNYMISKMNNEEKNGSWQIVHDSRDTWSHSYLQYFKVACWREFLLCNMTCEKILTAVCYTTCKVIWEMWSRYGKKTKGWQGGICGLMLIQGHLLSKTKHRILRLDGAQTVSPAAPKILFTFCYFYASQMKQAMRSYICSLHRKSSLWCDSTCLTSQSGPRPTLLELN